MDGLSLLRSLFALCLMIHAQMVMIRGSNSILIIILSEKRCKYVQLWQQEKAARYIICYSNCIGVSNGSQCYYNSYILIVKLFIFVTDKKDVCEKCLKVIYMRLFLC